MRLRDYAQGTSSRCSAQVLGGRYRVDGLLGSGGAADVHRGFDLRLRRPIAVKVFRSGSSCTGPEGLDNEALILARLNHPGLITAFDAGQHGGHAFLIMQLVEGTTLKERIAKGPLSPGATAALGAGLAQALGHAHEAGVVHRDIKPSNILLDDADRPYLADFGISRLVDTTTHTATGTLTGTAAYMSPEQVLGQPVGRPTDIYALGLVLLECLTGRLEYDGGPLEAAIARLHRRPVLPDGLPARLEHVLRSMTALDEQDRPHAVACARTLSAVADTAPLSVRASTPATSVVAHRHAPETADRTHANPPLGGAHSRRRHSSGRRRTRTAGTVVAFTAVVATTLAATNASSGPDDEHTSAKATGAPSRTTQPPDPIGPQVTPTPSRNATPLRHGASTGDRPLAPTPAAGAPTESAQGTSADNAADRSDAASPNRPSSTAGDAEERVAGTPARPPGQATKTRAAERNGRDQKTTPGLGGR